MTSSTQVLYQKMSFVPFNSCLCKQSSYTSQILCRMPCFCLLLSNASSKIQMMVNIAPVVLHVSSQMSFTALALRVLCSSAAAFSRALWSRFQPALYSSLSQLSPEGGESKTLAEKLPIQAPVQTFRLQKRWRGRRPCSQP